MAFIYTAGLRIRPPEPMPSCAEGESAQDYFSRVLTQCALESATSSENASGDSAPTPFNIGQIQGDLARAQADIVILQTRVTEVEGDVSSIQSTLNERVTISGVGKYLSGDASVEIPLSGADDYVILVTPNGAALASLYVVSDSAGFEVHFTAAGADGTFNWVATKQ